MFGSRILLAQFGLIVSLLVSCDLLAIDRCRSEPDVVVLLHGLSRTPRSMRKIEAALENDGYEVVNVAYPSRRYSIEELAPDLDVSIAQCCRGRDRYVHFVTHSLGGIVLRYYLKSRPLDNIGRVVMLSPPNTGSELVDLLRKIPLARDHIGPSRGQLGTDPADLPRSLGPVEFELGVIAGRRTINPLFSWIIPGEDDGMVATERTKVDDMKDYLMTPHTHTFIMRSPDVIYQIRTFLRRGEFDHEAVERVEGERPSEGPLERSPLR